MSLHYMFCTFCSIWHVAVKLICSHLFAITWLRHDVVMWAHVHYHMVQLFACFYKMQGWISSHCLMNPCRTCNLCAWNSQCTNKRKPLLHIGWVKVPNLGTFMQCANQWTSNWRLYINNAIVLHPDVLPPMPSHTDDKEDDDDDGGDEEDEVVPADREE